VAPEAVKAKPPSQVIAHAVPGFDERSAAFRGQDERSNSGQPDAPEVAGKVGREHLLSVTKSSPDWQRSLRGWSRPSWMLGRGPGHWVGDDVTVRVAKIAAEQRLEGKVQILLRTREMDLEAEQIARATGRCSRSWLAGPRAARAPSHLLAQ
jgi:hypothetical protein